MASVNKVILLGNLGRDPEVKATSSGSSIANFSIATSRKVNGETQTEWHNIVAFGKVAEICAQYLKKGSSVYIEGRLRTRDWVKDGQKHYTTEILCDMVQMLGGWTDGNKTPQNTAAEPVKEESDLPF